MWRPFLRAIAILVAVAIAAGFVAHQAGARDLQSTSASFEALTAEAKSKMVVAPAQAIELARRAEALASRKSGRNRAIGVATALWLQGEAYLQLNESGRATPLIDRAIALVSTAGPVTKLNGDLLLSKGGFQTSTADVAGALSSYQRAHQIFHEVGETRSRSIALICIGILYQEANDNQTALRYYGQALDVFDGDPQLLYSIHNNRGNALKELGRFKSALAEFQTTLIITRSLKSSLLTAKTLRNIARVELLEGQVRAADQTIAQGAELSRGAEALADRNQFLVLSAWSARLRDHLTLSERLITRALVNVDPEAPTLDVREAHQTAYDIFKQAGNQAQALIHLEALKALDDKTSELAASANTALAAARFDFASQELNLEKLRRAQLQRNIDDAKLRARTQQTIFGGAAVATLIIMAMLAFGLITIRRSRNEVRAANVDLAKTNAALAKALAAKTEFLATTSHEIRTPLNGILGMTQVMLADRTLTDSLRDRIGVVHGAGVSMRALVDDILDVAKMETGNLTLEDVPYDLKATLRDVSRLWEEQARAKGVRFVLDLDGCPDHVVGDAARVRQIAFNLLSNALKFTAAGEIRLAASARDSVLAIAVTDSGIGIPADKLGIIFESFRQVDAGTTRQFGGTGLGLAICLNLAEAMDGAIGVTSTVGSGSTFTLELPLRLAAAPAAVAVDPAVEATALLILDRNPISRSMLRAVLAARAGEIVFASSVDEAVARIGEGGVAHVLIDDGTITAEPDLDAALATLGSCPVRTTLLWPAPDEAHRVRFSVAGIDQLVAKPIAGVALAAVLFDSAPDDGRTVFTRVTQAA
ncbi:ATP-binding protein [Sphingomonas glacialis]|uniref:ATP-binding protein n=1 Tax=Sphingomonas glacialis TaxID=658225 RepID=UPI001679A0A8|nr:ATP-binding protein [Sphingomonas glacialis]